MERVKSLGRYQKAILILMIIMITVFTLLYSITVSREGFEFMDTILVSSQEGGSTVYSGKIQENPAIFTVFADKTVTFQYGDKTYGPYTVTEDAAAVPPGRDYLKGIEVRCGEEVLFRGGTLKSGDYWMLIDEDGDPAFIDIQVNTSDDSSFVDQMAPSVSTILELISDPVMTHKGEWIVWVLGVFVCLVAAVFLFFADEIFYLGLAFRIRNPEYAKPSDWEIAGRYMAWTVLPALALVVFILGLQ